MYTASTVPNNVYKSATLIDMCSTFDTLSNTMIERRCGFESRLRDWHEAARYSPVPSSNGVNATFRRGRAVSERLLPT